MESKKDIIIGDIKKPVLYEQSEMTPTEEILSIKSSKLARSNRPTDNARMGLASRMVELRKSMIKYFYNQVDSIYGGYKNIVLIPFFIDVEDYLIEEEKKHLKIFLDEVQKSGSSSVLSPIASNVYSQYEAKLNAIAEITKHEKELLDNGDASPIDKEFEDLFPRHASERWEFVNFVRNGGDRSVYKITTSQPVVQEERVEQPKSKNRSVIRLSRVKNPSTEKMIYEVATLEEEKIVSENTVAPQSKKRITEKSDGEKEKKQLDIDAYIEKSLRTTRVEWANPQRMIDENIRDYAPFFTSGVLRGETNELEPPNNLRVFIERTLNKEKNLWMINDLGFQRVELEEMSDIPEGENTSKLFKGVLELNRDEMAFSLDNLWTISEAIASGYEVDPALQFRFTNLTSQAVGFLYSSFSVHGPNLMRLSETLFNEKSGIGKDNVVSYLARLSRLGSTHSGVELLEKIQPLIREKINDEVVISSYTNARGKEIAVYGFTYIYNLLWEEAGGSSDWGVISTLARPRPLGQKQKLISSRFKNGRLINKIKNSSTIMQDFVEHGLANRCGSEAILTAFITLLTLFCEVNNGRDDTNTGSNYALDELTSILNSGRLAQGRINTFNRAPHILTEYMLDLVTYVLPRVVVNNYRFYANAAITKSLTPADNPLISYMKYCGFNINPIIPNNGEFEIEEEAIKVKLSDLSIDRGHFVISADNTFLRSISFNKEVSKSVKAAADVLRLMNHIVLFTPQIPRNLGRVIGGANPGLSKVDDENVLLHTLCSYLTSFAQIVFDNPPAGSYIYSMIVQFEIGATLNGEQISESLTLGGAEILNLHRDGLNKDTLTDSEFRKKLFNTLNVKIYRYIDFVRRLAQYFNNLTTASFDSVSSDESIRSWTSKHFQKFSDLMGSSSQDSFGMTEGLYSKLLSEARELKESDEYEIRELIEESNGSYYIFTWLALQAKAIHTSRSDGGNVQNLRAEIKLNSVGRARFTVNLISASRSSISDITRYLKTHESIHHDRFISLTKFLDDKSRERLYRALVEELELSYTAIGNLLVGEHEHHSKRMIDMERELFLYHNDEVKDFVDNLRAYNLFGSSVNDHLNNLNTGYVRFTKLNTPVEYFCTIGIPCSYFALWFFTFAIKAVNGELKGLKSDKAENFNIQILYEWVVEKICQLEEEKFNDRLLRSANCIQLYTKRILSPEIAFSSEPIIVGNISETVMVNMKSLPEDIETSRSIQMNINRGNTETDYLSIPNDLIDFWGYPLKEDGVIQSHVRIKNILSDGVKDNLLPKCENLIINPQTLMRNCYAASKFLNEIDTFKDPQFETIESFLREDKIIFADIPELLKTCIGESLSDFIMTVRRINIIQRKAYPTGVVYDGCIYFRECKSWLILEQKQPYSWLKASQLEFIKFYTPSPEVEQKKLLGESIQTITPYVFIVEKNHLTCLTPKESSLFIDQQTNNALKSQVECYSLKGKVQKLARNARFALLSKNNLEEFMLTHNLQHGYFTSWKRYFNDKVLNNPSMLCAWDIESYVGDNKEQIPHVISLIIFTDTYFYLANQINHIHLERDIERSILLTKSFVGDNCIDSFVDFLMDFFFNNTCEEILGYIKEEIFLFTFNGTRYDHPLVIKKLLKSGCDIIGEGLNNPKSIIVNRSRDSFVTGLKSKNQKMAHRKLIFNDFLALHPTGSLASVCKTLFPLNPELHKSKFDIGGLSRESFISQIRPITRYCEQDCKALLTCILINKINTNKLIRQIIESTHLLQLQQNGELSPEGELRWAELILPWKFDIYSLISASQWTFEIYKTYFMPFYNSWAKGEPQLNLKGEINENIHQIVKSTYRGGLTCVYTEEFIRCDDEDLQIYDINSSYPHSMIQAMPYMRFKSTPTEVKINGDSPVNTFKDMNLYFVGVLDMGKFSPYRYYNDNEEYNKILLQCINPQDIFPFAQHSSNNKVKDLGLIYPRIISEQWIWGKELNVFISTYSSLMENEPHTLGDIFLNVVIGLELEQEPYELDADREKMERQNFLFKPFIEFFYNMKSNCKTDENLKPLEPLYKLFLNGLYGKFGQSDFPETSYAYGAFDLKSVARDESSISIKMCDINPKSINPIFKIETKKGYRSSGACVRLASYISMNSRMNLWKTMVMITSNVKGYTPSKRAVIYYCDTDSIFMSGNFPVCYQDNKKLGAWKKEDPLDYVRKYCPGVSEETIETFSAEHAFFMAPKCYGIFSRKMLSEFKNNMRMFLNPEDLNETSQTLTGWVKTKGVSKGKITLEGFLELIVNRSLTISQLQFRRKLGSVYVDENFRKTMRLKYKKRIFTSPLVSSYSFETIQDFENYVLPLLKQVI